MRSRTTHPPEARVISRRRASIDQKAWTASKQNLQAKRLFVRDQDQLVAPDPSANARDDPRVVADPRRGPTVTAVAAEAGAAARAGVAAVVGVLEVVIKGVIAAVAVIVAQVASVTVAVANLATRAESNNARVEEGPEVVVVAAAEATVAAAAAAVVDLVPGTGNEMEVARDNFRNRLSGAPATATTMGTKTTRAVAGEMAKEAVAADKSYLEPTRSWLLRSVLVWVQRVAPNRDLVLDPNLQHNIT